MEGAASKVAQSQGWYTGAVGRKSQFLLTLTSTQGCLSGLTTWLPLPPEQVIQERKGGKSSHAFYNLPPKSHCLFHNILLVTWVVLVQGGRGTKRPEYQEVGCHLGGWLPHLPNVIS